MESLHRPDAFRTFRTLRLLEVQGSLGLCPGHPGPGSKLSSSAVTAFVNRGWVRGFVPLVPLVPRWLPLAERPLSRQDLLDLRYDMLWTLSFGCAFSKVFLTGLVDSFKNPKNPKNPSGFGEKRNHWAQTARSTWDPHEIHMMLSSFDPCVVHLPGWSFAGLVSCGCSTVTIRSFRGYTGYTSSPWCQNRYFIFSRPHFKLLHLLLLSIDLKTRRTTDAFHQDSNSSVPIFELDLKLRMKGSNGIKWDQMGSNGIKWDQMGSNIF